MTGIKLDDVEYFDYMNHTISIDFLTPKIPVKKLTEDAQIPTKEAGDAGWDLYSVEDVEIKPGERKVIKTGISMEIPNGYAGLIWPRSGLSVKSGLDVLAGVIDSSYRGEIMVCLHNTNPSFITSEEIIGTMVSLVPIANTEDIVKISKGDRIAQMIIQHLTEHKMVEATELSETERGEKGFGSSGS